MSALPVPDLRAHLSALFAEALQQVAPNAGEVHIALEKPKQAQHGDYASSIALQLAKRLRQKPREVAERLVQTLPASPYLDRAEVAGPGFINLFLKREFKQQTVQRILLAGAD